MDAGFFPIILEGFFGKKVKKEEADHAETLVLEVGHWRKRPASWKWHARTTKFWSRTNGSGRPEGRNFM